MYLASWCSGKPKVKGFTRRSVSLLRRDEWIVMENTHEPIVTQETWDVVQKLTASRTDKQKNISVS